MLRLLQNLFRKREEIIAADIQVHTVEKDDLIILTSFDSLPEHAYERFREQLKNIGDLPTRIIVLDAHRFSVLIAKGGIKNSEAPVQ